MRKSGSFVGSMAVLGLVTFATATVQAGQISNVGFEMARPAKGSIAIRLMWKPSPSSCCTTTRRKLPVPSWYALMF